MNYIELINNFWAIDLEATFSHAEVHLFFKLLEINNRLGWKNEFRYPNARLEGETGMRSKTLINTRQRLVDCGVLFYKKGNTRNAGTYSFSYCKQPTKESNQESIQETNQPIEPTKESNQESNQGNNREVIKGIIGGTLTKQNKTKQRKSKSEPLLFPFNSEKFLSLWKMLLEMPKWKKKVNHSLQLALNSLGKYDEGFAIELIEKAIEGNWQGVTFPNTPDDYEKWKKRNGKSRRNFETKSHANESL